MSKHVTAPWPYEYDAEMDVTPELSADLATYFQSEIGVLRWMVELGRVDMITEVSILASQLALPREGHLDAVFHIFAYLKSHHNACICIDPTYANIDLSVFQEHDWKHFYGCEGGNSTGCTITTWKGG